MPRVSLSAGTIEYEEYDDSGDTGASGTGGAAAPTLVFLHGLTIDASVWRDVLTDLGPGYRCVLPTLPLGAHRTPMRPDADLSLRGMALLVGEFLEALDLRDVTLVLNDWGGAQLLLSEGRDERIGRLVLTSCEAFDNYPPGLPGRLVAGACRVPGGLRLMMHLLRFRPFRRAPGGWGWMSKRPVPDVRMDAWFDPARRMKGIRRDLTAYVRSVPDRRTLLEQAERMRSFDRPVLVVWATEDRLMPREHGRRLAGLFPNARLVELDDSYTLIPVDRPRRLAELLRDFVPRG